MGGTTSNQPYIASPGEYHQHFSSVAATIKNGPVEGRSCKDICCLVFFIIFTITFIAMGVYFISNANLTDPNYVLSTLTQVSEQSNKSKMKHLAQRDQLNLQFSSIRNLIIIVAAMAVLGLILSIVLLCLISQFPKVMVYGMLILSTLLLIGAAVALILVGFWPGAIVVFCFLLIWACMLFCFRKKIPTGIILLKVASNFLQEKPTVFLAPVFTSILGFGFSLFFFITLLAIQLDYPKQEDQTTRNILSGVWLFLGTFFGFFIFYITCFLIATATALWYYSIDRNYLTTAFKWILGAHIGSLTFASLLITIIQTIREGAQGSQENSGNGCATCCLCFLTCIFRGLQQLVRVLNHNAIIVMSVTGESYIDSAKSTISLLLGNFGLFVAVDAISAVITLCSMIFIVGIPAVSGYFLIQLTQEKPSVQERVVGVIAITFLCFITAHLFLSVLSEALSCVFIFYCFDKKFQQLGFPVVNRVPAVMKELILQVQQENPGPYQRPPSEYFANPPGWQQPNWQHPNNQWRANQPNHNNRPYNL